MKTIENNQMKQLFIEITVSQHVFFLQLLQTSAC